MGAIEPEFRIAIMIELLRLPAVRSVAARAIGVGLASGFHLHRNAELAAMIIVMASLAGNRKLGEFHRCRVRFVFLMTSAAGGRLVASLQRKLGLSVIKTRLTPAFDHVAEFAARSGNVLVHLALMRISMAGNTAGVFKLEADGAVIRGRRYLCVAGYARHRQMAAGQRIFRLGMLFYCESGRHKTGYGMAFFADAPAFPRRELAAMIIVMTIKTLIEPEPLERFSGKVASVTRHEAMFASEREFRLRMIEFSFVDALPARRIMAALAILAEFVIMRILMTIKAAFVSNAGESRIFLVIFE